MGWAWGSMFLFRFPLNERDFWLSRQDAVVADGNLSVDPGVRGKTIKFHAYD